jgi:hypothetical protein
MKNIENAIVFDDISLKFQQINQKLMKFDRKPCKYPTFLKVKIPSVFLMLGVSPTVFDLMYCTLVLST